MGRDLSFRRISALKIKITLEHPSRNYRIPAFLALISLYIFRYLDDKNFYLIFWQEIRIILTYSLSARVSLTRAHARHPISYTRLFIYIIGPRGI